MPSEMRGVKLVTLLAVLWSVAAATANLCTVLSGITRRPLINAVDGFSYDFFADMKEWIATQSCDSSSTQIQWTSDWLSRPDLVYSSNGVTGSGGQVKFSLSGNSTQGSPFYAVATVTVSMSLYKNAKISDAIATFGFDVRFISSDLAGRFPPTWQGSLKTTSTSGLGVFDDDLFDGAGPFVVDEVSSGSQPSSADIAQASAIAALAAEVNQRFRNFEPIPTALSGDVTARAAFPPTSILGVISSDDIHLNGTSGFVASRHGECRGLACGLDAKRTLTQLVAADTVCREPALMEDSMYGSLRATVGIENNKNVYILGVRAAIHAVFACSSGFIGISLGAVADQDSTLQNNGYSLRMFKEDTRASIAQIKTIDMNVLGRRYGYVTRDGTTIMTPVETDMFGYGRGGAFVDDVVITQDSMASFQNAVSTIGGLLKGQYPTVNDAFSVICSPDAALKTAKRYFVQVAHPTSYGLWSYWAEQFNGFDVARDEADNKLILEINSHINTTYTYESSDPSVTAFNNMLLAVDNDVKEACGSACSSLTGTPVLSADVITDSQLSIAVSASVSIPTMSLSADNEKSNDAMRQIKIIPRMNAQTDSEDVHMEFAAKLTASLASQGSSLDTVNIIYSSVLGKAAMVSGTAVSTVTGVLQPFAAGVNGKTVFNVPMNINNLRTLASSFSQQVSEIAEQEGHALESLTQLNDHSSSQTISQVLSDVASHLPTTGGNTCMGYLGTIRSLVEGALVSAGVIPFLSLHYDQSSNVLSFDLTYCSVRRIGFEASGISWAKNVPISRTELNLPLSSVVSFDFGSRSLHNDYSIKGYSHAQGFSLPIREGMRVGLAVAGFAETVINIPSYAYITVSFNGNMERGSTFTGLFRGNMTVNDPDTPIDQLFSFTMDEDNRGGYAQQADPSATLAALGDNFLFPSAIAQHQIQDALAPLNASVQDIVDLETSWKEKTTWIYSSEAFPYVFLQSVTFPMSAFSETVNITVNTNYTYTNCVFDIPSASTIDDLLASMKQGVAACGDLASFVRVDYTAGHDSDYSIVMVPQYAGSIYSFVVTAPDESQTIMRSQTWDASRITPDHLSWNDLYNGVYLAVLKSTKNYNYSLPVYKTIKVADANLVDASRARFYPSEIPGVTFEAAVSYHNPPKRVPIDPQFEPVEEEEEVDVTLQPKDVVLVGDLTMEVTFGMAFWCSLGDGILPFYTSFTPEDGNKYWQVKVPDSPNNQFTFVATAEKRLASAVTSTPAVQTISQTITLTPGKLLIDALIGEMPGQLSALASQMITVERFTDEANNETVQARILFKPYQADSDTLYVPLEFTVEPTNLVAFGSSTSYSQVKAMTSCPINNGFTMQVNVSNSEEQANDETVDCTGSIGVAEITACKAKLDLNFTFLVKNSREYSLLGDMHNVIPSRDMFSDWFNNSAILSASLNVNNMTFNVHDNQLSDVDSETLVMSKSVNVPFRELKSVSAPLYDVTIPSGTATGRALSSLMTTNRGTFCDGLKQSFTKVTEFAEDDSMNQPLPFTTQHMAPIYKTLINEHLEDAMESVCSVTNDRVSTLSGFCNELKNKFGFDVCGNTTLSDNGLEIPLLIRPSMAYAPVAFQFDSKRIIPQATFSSAFGNSGDLLLDTQVSADIGMNVNFVASNETNEDTIYSSEVELDPRKTAFTSQISHGSAPRLKTLLGSTVVTFDSQKLNLDVAITGRMTGNANAVEVTLDGSAHFDAHAENDDESYYCHVTADVPVVEHYFHRPANAWEDTVTFNDDCLQGTFVAGVEDSFSNMTLAHYFEQSPDNFFKQFDNSLVKDLFDYILETVTNKAVAFIGKKIQDLADKAFDNIIGPEAASKIADEITAMVSNLIKSGQYPDPTDLERVVVTFFTGILNRVFSKILYNGQEIADPGPGDVITWVIQFGADTTKDLTAIDWACGEHGLADLEVTSQNQLVMHWNLFFNLVFNKSSGFSIEWPGDKPLDASITLNGNGFDMTGSILWLTADLNGALTLGADLNYNPKTKALGFTVNAGMDTQGKLGLVKKIRQETKGDKANALGALPYVSAGVKASWAFDWNSQNGKPTTPKSFQFTEPQLCLGSIITEFMQQVSREVDRILKPLDPVFGPDGILQKPIPGISKIFGDHCNVLSILEWTCNMFSSSCQINTVKKLVNVLNEIAADIGKIKEFEAFLDDPEGCMDFAYLYHTFNISWGKDNPTPDDPDSPSNGIIPMTPQEKFYNVSYEHQQPLHDIMAKWAPANTYVIPHDCVNCTEADAVALNLNDGDKFGFKLDILENFPEKLISLLLGENVALFSVSFPEATLSYSVSWSIPVWSVPYIAVTVYAGASVSFQPPSVALMSNGIIDTVRTHNPSHLFRNLAVSTTTAFATGTLEVDGGVEGGINIIIAKVTVNFDITVKFVVEARIANFDGTDWATFDTILMQVHKYGFNGAIQFKLQLRGGFKLYLKTCIKILFIKKCWNLCSWSWDTTLWSWEPKNDLIKSVASSSGQIDANSFDFTYPLQEPSSLIRAEDNLRSYTITDSCVMFMPADIVDGNAALTRSLANNIGITFGYLPCTVDYNIIIDGDIKRPSVSLPSCDKVHISVKQMGYRTVEMFTISSTSIMPEGRNAITYSQCGSVSLDEPVYGTHYVVTGSPACPLTIDTEYSSVLNLTGLLSDYKGSVTITGSVNTIYAAITCTNITIHTTSIQFDSLTVTIPANVTVIKAAASKPEPMPHPHPHPIDPPVPVKLTLADVPEWRTVEVIGADPYVDVQIPQMSSMAGYFSFVGNTGDDNYIHVDMDTPADSDIICTAYPSQLAYNDSDSKDRHVVRHQNVNVRHYNMKAAPGRKSTMRVIPPDSYESISVNMIGAKDAVLRNELRGCDRRSQINVSMSNEGTHTLVIGADGTLEDFECAIRVFTDGIKNADTSIREIVVNATYDTRPLSWIFTDSEFSVSNGLDSSEIFHVYTDGLDHVTVYLTQMNGNRLTVNKADDDGTEYVFVFPEGFGMSNDYSSIQISETKSPLLFQGPVMALTLGDLDGTVPPLSKIAAVVVAPRGSNIMMNSENSEIPMAMSVSGNCVREQSAAGVPRPSDWFINIIEQTGTVFTEGCNVLLPNVTNTQSLGFGTTLDISAGATDDTLEVMNSAADVVANMGAGDDSVVWLSPDSTSKLFLQMGEGADKLSVQSAGPVNVDLGDDEKEDYVTVVCRDVSPSIVHSSVFPIGVAGSDVRLEISSWDSFDTVEIARYSLTQSAERGSAIIACDVAGANIKYQQNDNTDYHVKMCTNNTKLAFTTSYQGFGYAKNTNIEIGLDSYDDICNVNVDSSENSNGSVKFGVGANAQVIPTELSLKTGSATFGNMNVALNNVDHIGVAFSPAFSENGTLTISGAPVKQDIFINLPSWSTVVSENVKNITIMTVGSNAHVKELDMDGQGVLVSLSSLEVPTELDLGSKMKEMTLTNGCLESSNKRVLSEWILDNAKNAGFELEPEQNCAAIFKGLRFLMLYDSTELETARMSGLGWTSVRSVYLPKATQTVELETTNTVTKDTLWTLATMRDRDLMVARMQDDAFHVTFAASTGKLSVAAPVFAPNSQFIVNCTDSSANIEWNFASNEDHRDCNAMRNYFTDVNFSSNGKTCHGRINNRIFASMESAPSVTLVKGVGASVLVETSGSKEANLIQRYVNLSNTEGINHLRLHSFDRVSDEAEIAWDATLTGDMTVRLGDRSENAIILGTESTSTHPLHLSADVHSALSFPDLGNKSISFEGVDPAHFNVATKSFDLLGGKSASTDVFCFKSWDMCSAATWNEIRAFGQPCSLEKVATSQCTEHASVHILQDTVPALLSVSCGKAKWDPTSNSHAQGSISFNENGAEGEFVTVIPEASKIVASVFTISAALATVIGASVLISRMTVAIGKTVLPNINRWWMSNMMRDFFNDQFSWSSIVLTACLGGISNYDISNWGGPVDGLVVQTRSLVFDWFNFCESTYSTAVLVIWTLTVAAAVLRVLTLIASHKEGQRWRNLERVLSPVHSVVSSLTLLVLPLAGYAVPILMSMNILPGVITLICAIAIIASVPMGRFDATTRVRIIASYIAITLPFLVALVSGIGASRGVILALLLISATVLPLCNTFVLWKLFFAGADTRTKAWKHALFWTFGLRAASLICGLLFISTLFFDLSAVASGFSYTFWSLWVVLPVLQLIPLIMTTKYSNIVPRNFRTSAYYGPINAGETTPLRTGSSSSVGTSMNSVANISAEKDMADITSA